MNTKGEWKTTVTIHDEPRRRLWEVIFLGAVVPIKSIIPQKANLPGHLNADVYMLDLEALTEDQLWSVGHILSSQFNVPVDEVRAELHLGVPILAEGVSVSTTDQGILFSMMDGVDESYSLDSNEEPYRWDKEESEL